MKRVCLILLLGSTLLLCSCTKAGAAGKNAARLMSGGEQQSVFDLSGRLSAEGSGLETSAIDHGISVAYTDAVFYGGFVYIPFTISGYDGKELPDFRVSGNEPQEAPYYIDEDMDEDGTVKGAVYWPLREYQDSIGLKISDFCCGGKTLSGNWEAEIPVKMVSDQVLELEPEREKTVNVFDAEYEIKKVTLTDFSIRIECGLKSRNFLTEEEWMQRIVSSESTGKSGYYDSYIQALYQDGTVSPRYSYSLADWNVMWAWFLEEGQIDAKNVRALYIGDSEFIVE